MSEQEPPRETVEPEVIDPTGEELALDGTVPALPTSTASHDSEPTPVSTSLVPVTALQQYLMEVRRYPYISKEEELLLFKEYQVHGNRDAAMKVILANLRVSVAIAAEYLHTGADHMDLIQEGNIGLLQAIKRFDPTKNVRFYAYAAWWARAYILRYLLNTYRLVKIGTTRTNENSSTTSRKKRPSLSARGMSRIQSSWPTD